MTCIPRFSPVLLAVMLVGAVLGRWFDRVRR